MATTLYVSDMDGTLLGGESRLSATSAALLHRAITERGALFTVATARTAATAVPLMTRAGLRLPLLTMSGAAWWLPGEARYSFTQPVDEDTVQQVLDVFDSHGVQPFVYRRHGSMLLTHHAGRLSAVEREFVDRRKGTPFKQFMLGDAARRTSADEALLLFAMGAAEALQVVYDTLLEKVSCHAVLYHDNIDPSLALLEVYRRGCSKGSAVRRLAQMVGATRVVAFGDNLNDLDMLAQADVAVAVANAVPQVLAAAQVVIEANTADAVAKHVLVNS